MCARYERNNPMEKNPKSAQGTNVTIKWKKDPKRLRDAKVTIQWKISLKWREILPQQSNKSISLRCAKYKRKNEMKNNPKKKRIVNVHTKLALQLNEKI